MATRIAVATGNFTATGTWLTVDATSLSDSEANNTALTTAYTNSQPFTPGAITVDGVAIKVASRAAGSPSNTITLRLGQAGADVAGTVTTMNVSDIPQCDTTSKEGGWVYFRFNVAGTPTPVLLLAATAYTVGVKLSATSTAVNLFRTSTATDWSRMLATTTTGAPGAADILHVMGDNLSAGVSNAYTVTMENTASTTFGVAANTTGCLTVSKGGTLTWETSASTAYLLKVAGTVYVYSGGTWNQGTSGTRMPSTSTGKLQFAITSNVDGGMWVKSGATFNAYGATKTNWTYLNTDEAAAQTVLGVVDTTGWAASDQVCIASTTRTYTQSEVRTISTVDSSTQITVTSGLTNAHSGTAPTRAEVGNITRNVAIFGTSTSLQGYVRFDATATVNCDSVEFYWLGSNTSNKKGIDINTSTGTCNLTGCSFHDFVVSGSAIIATSSTTRTFAMSNCVIWLITNGFGLGSTATTNLWTVDSCLFMGGTGVSTSVALVVFPDIAGGAFTNNTMASSGLYGLSLSQGTLGTFSGITCHSCSSYGIYFFPSSGNTVSGTIGITTVYRNNNSHGLYFNCSAVDLLISGGTIFGNSLAGIYLGATGAATFTRVVISGVTLTGDTTFSQSNGIRIESSYGLSECIIDTCSFGVAAGILVSHATADIVSATDGFHGLLSVRNTILGSSTEVAGTYSPLTVIASQKHDQTDGLNKRWEKYGIVCTDTVTYRTSSPSIALTPNNASNKLRATLPQRHFEVPVNSGESVTFTCYVNKSGSYNGNQPRLLLLSNSAIGITSDTVVATASGGTGSWLTLSGTTAAANAKGVMEFTVDCDGTVGTVYVSDISVTGVSAKDTTSPAYWHDGQPIVMAPAPSAGSGGIMVRRSYSGGFQ